MASTLISQYRICGEYTVVGTATAVAITATAARSTRWYCFPTIREFVRRMRLHRITLIDFRHKWRWFDFNFNFHLSVVRSAIAIDTPNVLLRTASNSSEKFLLQYWRCACLQHDQLHQFRLLLFPFLHFRWIVFGGGCDGDGGVNAFWLLAPCASMRAIKRMLASRHDAMCSV